jgi:amino acid permease
MGVLDRPPKTIESEELAVATSPHLQDDAFPSPQHHPNRSNIDPSSGVKRGLHNRHLSMMALAGIIGPGLLVGSGGALASGGPASLIIGFGVIGIVAFSIMQSLGELTTLYPAGGGFVGFGERVVDKGFSAAVGWVSEFPSCKNQFSSALLISRRRGIERGRDVGARLCFLVLEKSSRTALSCIIAHVR